MADLVAHLVALLDAAEAVVFERHLQSAGIGVAHRLNLAGVGIELDAEEHPFAVGIFPDLHLSESIDATYCFFVIHDTKVQYQATRGGDKPSGHCFKG